MNYLIQNFFFNTQKIFVTPKLKLFFFLMMFNKLIFFKKIYHFSIYSFNNFFFINSYFQYFYKYFFFNQILKFIKKKPSYYFSFYENNLLKSVIYWIYNLFLSLRTFNKNKNYSFLFFNNSLFINTGKNLKTYKILNYKLTHSFYKNLFFLFMLLNSDFWFYYNNTIKFYLNFFFISNKFSIYPFFGGYFFNIYNF